MVDIQSILLRYFRDKESISKISTKLRLDRKTVRRYIRLHQKQSESPYNELSISEGLTKNYTYNSSKRGCIKLTQEVQDKIDCYLLKNQKKIDQGLRKQVMKAIDIHELLVLQDIEIAYSTISHYVAKKKKYSQEAFIKQIYKPGYACEFDWGEVKLIINGSLQTFQLAVFTHSYSNYRYAKLYHRQDMICFADSHIQYFSHMGGVVREMVYDNMRVAVSKFVSKSEKEPTSLLLEMANYYQFGWRFCNARKGNEKGHVERSVEFIRRKSFCHIDAFTDIDAANSHLGKALIKINKGKQRLANNKTADELLQDERKYLHIVPKPYRYYQTEHSRVDKYSTVKFKQNSYSVPDKYVGKLLELRLYPQHIEIFFNEKPVCVHQRSYKLQNWQICIDHYFSTLMKKPGALHSSIALKQADSRLQNIYTTHFINKPKEFIELLQYITSNKIDIENLCSKVNEVAQLTPNDVSKDKVLVMLENKNNTTPKESTTGQTEYYSIIQINKLSKLFTNTNQS